MPCPYFEPLNVAAHPQYANARVPLIDEYDGLCHAGTEPLEAPPEMRFRGCNHGYSKECCKRFPTDELRSSFRYDIASRSETALNLVCIEEQDYVPLRWRSITYVMATERLEPELEDQRAYAQALAFCRSYLAHFDKPAGR